MRQFLALALAFVLTQSVLGEDKQIRLRVTETAGIRRFGYPVSVVLTLDESVEDTKHFHLLSGGKPVSAQFRPHGDTSKGIRTVSLDFNASPGPLEKQDYIVEYGPGMASFEPKSGLRVESTEKEFRIVHPGGLQFAVPRDLAGLLNQVETKKLRFLNPGSTGLILQKKNLQPNLIGERAGMEEKIPSARFKPVGKVVKEGPLAIGLRFENAKGGEGAGGAPFAVDMEFPISKSWVRFAWTVEDSQGDVVSLGADLNLHVEGSPTLLDFGAGTSVYAQLKDGESARLRQNARERPANTPSWTTFVGTEKDFRPYVLAPGSSGPTGDAEGWAHVMDRQRCTAVAVADFAKSPEGADIIVSQEGRLRLWRHFGPPGSDAPRGKKQLTFWLHFVDMPVHVGAATSPQAMLAPVKVEIDDKR
jgi:hypothetical protein